MESSRHYSIKTNDKKHLGQLASVGQIAAGIAHEVRNPLTSVKGFLQLLKETKNFKYIDIAQSELDAALETLNNLLQISKPDLEDEKRQPFLLSADIDSILLLFQDKLYNVTVTKNFQNTDIQIYGKRNHIKKAIFNLLKNAFEAIEEQGTIHVEHFLEDSQLVVVIEDSGVGIPEDQLSKLGTPFFSTKENGTGMGLTQVFSVIYEHGGTIEVESELQKGTKFTITFPLRKTEQTRGNISVNLHYVKGQTIMEFINENKEEFQERLLKEAINVKDKINEILEIGNINLLKNAQLLVGYIVDTREKEVIQFAKQEGVAWAKYQLTLAFKLEWIHAIRRTLWSFLYEYNELNGKNPSNKEFFTLEKSINEMVDQFLNHFFISYSQYKDDQLLAQRQMVEKLSVPIIPISPEISILPLIGTIDDYRMKTIEEKVLFDISKNRIEKLIIDLSGVGDMDPHILDRLGKTIDGISMMGCKTFITGMRADVVLKILRSGFSIDQKAETKGTLQQALNDIIKASQEYDKEIEND